MITKKESLVILYAKAIAIISVVCAHVSWVPEGFSAKSQYVCGVLNEIGAIGVGLFFVISGYLFRRKATRPYAMSSFFKNKIRTIVIPWFVAAFLVYLYVALRKGGSVKEGVLSVLGYKSSYWYLAVLMALYFAFILIRRSEKEGIYVAISSIVSLLSVFLRYVGVIKPTVLGVYLNVFNWSIFFAIGYWGALHINGLQRLLQNRLMTMIAGLISALALIMPYSLNLGKFSYFCFWYIPTELIIVWFIVSLCYSFSAKMEMAVFSGLGKISYSVYLYHELLWAGLIVAICNKIDSVIFVLFRPFFVMVFVCAELYMGWKLFKLIKMERLYFSLIGARLK